MPRSHLVDEEHARDELGDPLVDVLVDHLRTGRARRARSRQISADLGRWRGWRVASRSQEIARRSRGDRALLISDRSFSVISVFFGFIIWPIIDARSCPPCGRALARSRSWSVTSCTTSFFLCTSPGHSNKRGQHYDKLGRATTTTRAVGTTTRSAEQRRAASQRGPPLGRGTYSSASRSYSVA